MKFIRNTSIILIVLFFLSYNITILSADNLSQNENSHFGFTVLVTGFEPFNQYNINPSELIAEELNGQDINGATVVGMALPVDFEKSVTNITQAIEKYDPEVIISIGLDASAHSIHVEQIGWNLKKLDKSSGKLFRFRRIEKFGPAFYLSTVPTNKIVNKIKDADISVRQSFFAGTYVCNCVLYETLRYISKNNLCITDGFIHVPLMKSQDPNGMAFDEMLNAVKIAINVSLDEI